MAFKKKKAGNGRKKPKPVPAPRPVAEWDSEMENETAGNEFETESVTTVQTKAVLVPPRPLGAPPPEHCSHEFPGSEGKEFVYVIKPEHRDKYPKKKIVVPVD